MVIFGNAEAMEHFVGLFFHLFVFFKTHVDISVIPMGRALLS